MRMEDLAPIAVALIIVGVAVGIGANVTQQVAISTKDSDTITNQTVTFTNNTDHELTNTLVTGIISVSNFTRVFTSGNYSLEAGDDGSFLNISIFCGGPTGGNCTGNGATLNVTYTRDTKGGASLAASNSTAGIGELGEWLPTIGLIIAAAVIIGILFSAFYGGRGYGGKR